MSVSKTILIGFLGSAPEIRNLTSGDKVANFSLATSESYNNKQGEKVTNTEWHRIVIFGKLAGICEQYLKKGSQVYLEGKNKTEKYTNKDGVEVYTTKIVCREMTMLGSKSEQSQPERTNAAPTRAAVEEDGDPNSLPF